MRTIWNSAVTCSYPGTSTCAWTAAPSEKGDANRIWNHVPNSPESLIARHTRACGALRTTRFSILSASQNPPDLMLEIGDAWHDMAADTRDAELAAVFERARELGFTNLAVYSGGERVWERISGSSCPEGTCVVKEQEQAAPGGGVQISVEVTPLP